MQKIKRNVLNRQEYTAKEQDRMRSIHRCLSRAMPNNGISDLLKMNDDFTFSLHQISPEDTEKASWVGQLKHGLLQTETDIMIGHLCEYASARMKRILFRGGNPNDPYNLVCYEFLNWLTQTLSHAPCDENTLDIVKERCAYLDNLLASGVFKPGKLNKKTMRGALVSVQSILSGTVMLTIKREIANTHACEHLERLQVLGKIILGNGFQFLYHILNNTSKTPRANITRFRLKEPLYQNMASTRIGELLQTLIHTREFQLFFRQAYEPNGDLVYQNNDVLAPAGRARTTTLRAIQSTSNPFLNNKNIPAIPRTLHNSQVIEEYLRKTNTSSNSCNIGIYPVFENNNEILTSYIEMHALLVELAKVFLACDEAKALAGIGGDLLVYGISNEQINRLMDTLSRLCGALNQCQRKLYALCDHQYTFLTREHHTLKKENVDWVKNFEKIPSLQTLLVNAIDQCSEQAGFVKARANMILTEDWLTQAQEQTKFFAHTTAALNHHVDYFLQRQPTPPMVNTQSNWKKAISPQTRQNSDTTSILEASEEDQKSSSSPRRQLSTNLRTSLTKLSHLVRPSPQESTTESPTASLTISLRHLPVSDGSSRSTQPESDATILSSSKSPRQQLGKSLRTSLTKISDLLKPSRNPVDPLDDRQKLRRKNTVTERVHRDYETSSPPASITSHDNPPHTAQMALMPLPTNNKSSVIVKPQKLSKPIRQTIELIGDISTEQFIDDSTLAWLLEIRLQTTPEAVEIHLQKNRIGPLGAVQLCKLLLNHSPLEKLHCAGNNNLFEWVNNDIALGDEALKGWSAAKAFSNLLEYHRSLKELMISACGLTPNAAKLVGLGLAKNSSLETLDLSDNQMGDIGARAICEAASNHSTLKYLLMSGNSISNDCGELFCQLLRNKTQIEFLDISNNLLSDEMMVQINELLQSNQRQSRSISMNNM